MLLLEVVLHVVLHIVPYRSSCYSLRWNFSIKYITKLHHPVKSVSSGESRCMKGGKAGRTRKTSAVGTARQGSARGKPNKGNAKRAVSGPPKKGSRKKSFGATSTSTDE